MHTLQSKGVLANGTHTLTTIAEIETFLSGTALTIARLNLRVHGAVRVLVNVDYVPLAIEPHDFGEDREPEIICRVPTWLMPKVVRAKPHVGNRRGQKLSADDRAAILLSMESGQTLALRYGVSRQAISQVRNYQPKQRSKTDRRTA